MTSYPPEPPAPWPPPPEERPAGHGRRTGTGLPPDEWPARPFRPYQADRPVNGYGHAPGHPSAGGSGRDGYPGYAAAPGYPDGPPVPDYPDGPPAPGHPDYPAVPGDLDLPDYRRDAYPASGYPDTPGYPGLPDYPQDAYPASGGPDTPGYPPMPDYPHTAGYQAAAGYQAGYPATEEVPGVYPTADLAAAGHPRVRSAPAGPATAAAAKVSAATADEAPVCAAPAEGSRGAQWAILAYLTVPFFGFLVPLAIYLMSMRGPRWVRAHAAQAINVWLTGILYDLSAAIIAVVLVLDSPRVALTVVVPLITVLWLTTLAFLVRAAAKASRGEAYTFPRWLCTPMVR